MGGSNTQVIFNDAGVANGSANLTFDKTTNYLTVGGGSGGNLTGANVIFANIFTSNIATGTAPLTVSSTTTVANLAAATATTAGTVTTAAQPNITSVGTLSSLAVTGNITGGNANVTGQLISTVATSTAPLVVTSTTRVANLNVNYANVADYGVVTTQTTGTFYPVFVNGSTTANYAHASNANLSFNAATGNLSTTLLNVTSNANVGNLGFGTGVITGTGNITGGNLLGVHANGNSNVNIATANGNVTIAAVGNTTMTITGTGANITGYANISGNANVGNIGGTGAVFTTLGGSLTTAAQPNITSVGTLSSVAVTANANVGNLNATGRIIGVDNIIVGSSGGEGGQLVMGYVGITGITGQANSTWNVDVDGSNNFRIFTQYANGTASTPATFYSANTNTSFPNNVTASNVIATTNHIFSVATGISAAGATQATATAVSKDFNVVSTVTSGANGITLPTATAGMRITIVNTSANALNVYPLGNGIINTQSANAAYSQPAGARLDFICTTAATAPGGQWYTLNATYS